MKYETPKLTALTPAINAIQTPPADKPFVTSTDSSLSYEIVSAYEDWE
jgi:hypothetical protein